MMESENGDSMKPVKSSELSPWYKQTRSSRTALAPTGYSSTVFIARCGELRRTVQDRDMELIFANQHGQHTSSCYVRGRKLIILAISFFVIVCISSVCSPSLFVHSFSLTSSYSSGGRPLKGSTENSGRIHLATSSSSAEVNLEGMNRNLNNGIEQANLNNSKKNSGGGNEDLVPSLVDWRLEIDGQRITGRSVNHPFVPDGELITTASLNPTCLDSVLEDGDVVATVKGTRYELLEPPPIGASYFSTAKSSMRKGNIRAFKEDLFSYTTTGLPYDQQLAFLEELTDLVKTLQAVEIESNSAVSNVSPLTSDENPSTTSDSISAVSRSASGFSSVPSTLGQRKFIAVENDFVLPIDQLEDQSQKQLFQNKQLDTQRNLSDLEESPRRPTYSIDNPQRNQQSKEVKENPVSSNNRETGVSGGTLLGSATTIAAAATAAAAVTFGSQTGLLTGSIDEAKVHVEAQIPLPSKDLLASVNTVVEDQSRVILPYLEQQIQIAEAKIEEARLDEKAKNAWNEFAEYLNDQSHSNAAKKASTFSVSPSKTEKNVDYLALEVEASTSKVGLASSDLAMDSEASFFDRALENVGDREATAVKENNFDRASESPVFIPNKGQSAQSSNLVKEASVSPNYPIDSASNMDIVEELAPATRIEGSTTAIAIEADTIQSPTSQSFAGNQMSYATDKGETDSKALQVESLREQAAETIHSDAGSFSAQGVEESNFESFRLEDAVKAEDELSRSLALKAAEEGKGVTKAIEMVEAEADTLLLETMEKAEAETPRVDLAEKMEAEADLLPSETPTNVENEANAPRIATQERLEVATKAETNFLQLEAIERAETEAEIMQVKATEEEEELAQAYRIVSEQLEMARREVQEAAIENEEPEVITEIAAAAETKTAEGEIVKASKPFKKAASAVVESFGENSINDEEDLNPGTRSSVSGIAPFDVSQNNNGELMSENIIRKFTAEIEPIVDPALTREEEPGDNIVASVVEGTIKEELEISPASRSVSESIDMKVSGMDERRSIIERATEIIEKGKKSAQSIGDAGLDVIDASKRTVQTIETNGQELIDTGRRNYQTAVDTGKEVIDTGRKAIKTIEETARKVGTKGKEAYETGQKYAADANEKIHVMVEGGEKVVAVINEKVPVIIGTGQEILSDEKKAKAIAAGSTIIAAATAPTVLSIMKDKNFSFSALRDGFKGNISVIEEDFISLNGSNDNKTSITLFVERENENGLIVPSDSPTNSPQTSRSQESSVPRQSPKLGKTLDLLQELDNIPPSPIPSPKTMSDTTSKGKQYRFQEKSIQNSTLAAEFLADDSKKKNAFGVTSVPMSKFSPVNQSTTQDESATKESYTNKQLGFGVPVSSTTNPYEQAPSTFQSSSKTDTFGKELRSGIAPTKNTNSSGREPSQFGATSKSSFSKKQSESTLGSSTKKPILKKQVGWEVPTSKFGKQLDSPLNSSSKFKAFPKQPVSAFASPSLKQAGSNSKNGGFSKQVASPFASNSKSIISNNPLPSSFGSSPKKVIRSKEVRFGVPQPEMRGTGKQSFSPFGSSPKKAISSKEGKIGLRKSVTSDPGKQVVSPFGSPPKQSNPREMTVIGNTPLKSNSTDKKVNLQFGSSSKLATPGEKVAFVFSSSNSSGPDTKQASSFVSSPKTSPKKVVFAKKVAFGIPSPKSIDTDKKVASPFVHPSKSTSSDKKSASPFGSSQKRAAPGKESILGVPSSGRFGSEQKFASGIVSSTKQSAFTKRVKSKVPLSKSSEIGKNTISPFGSSSTQFSRNNQGAFGVPSSRSTDSRKQLILQSESSSTVDGLGQQPASPFRISSESTVNNAPSKSFDQSGGYKKNRSSSVSPQSDTKDTDDRTQLKQGKRRLEPDGAKAAQPKIGIPSRPHPVKMYMPSKLGVKQGPSQSGSLMREKSNDGDKIEETEMNMENSRLDMERFDSSESVETKNMKQEKESESPDLIGSSPGDYSSESNLLVSSEGSSKSNSNNNTSTTIKEFKVIQDCKAELSTSKKIPKLDASSMLEPPKKFKRNDRDDTTLFLGGNTSFPLPSKLASAANFDKGKRKSTKEATSDFHALKSDRKSERFISPFAEDQIQKSLPNERNNDEENETDKYIGKSAIEEAEKQQFLSKTLSGEKEKLNKIEVPNGFKSHEKHNSKMDESDSYSTSDENNSSLPGKTAATAEGDFDEENPNIDKPSVFDTIRMEDAETESLISPFVEVKYPPKKALSANSDSPAISAPIQSDETIKKSTKEKGRSYFTDTSRNGYNEENMKSYESSLCDNDDGNDDPIDLDMLSTTAASYDDFPSPVRAVSSSELLIENDRASGFQSTYLTEENQKSFFTQSSQIRQMELENPVESRTKENGLQKKPMDLTAGNQGTFPIQPTSSASESDDFKSRMTSIDENALNGNDGMYGKSPDELMAEVMRIAREQEERGR